METQRASAPAHLPDDLRLLLSREHARLDRLFRELLAAFEADARVDVARLWNEFDADLRAHMQLEEDELMPKFLEFNALDAVDLLRDHQRIRDKLLALGVGVDLHQTRHTQVAEFLRELRAHARREDELMYRWAEQCLEGEPRQSLLQYLLAKLH